MSDGMAYTVVASKLSKGDPKAAKVWRARIRTWIRDNPAFREALAVDGRTIAMAATGPIVEKQVQRAMRGRTDAAKLVMEISGFHNPKVQHDHKHSGTIDIKLTMGGRPEPVVDAEVVED